MMDLESGKDLRKWRKSHGLTQEQLAKKAHYTKSRISHIEASDEKLSQRMLQEVSEIENELNPPSMLSPWYDMKKNDNYFHYDQYANNVEGALSKLLNVDITDLADFQTIIRHLNFLKEAFTILDKMMNLDPSNPDIYKQNSNKLCTELLIALKDYHT